MDIQDKLLYNTEWLSGYEILQHCADHSLNRVYMSQTGSSSVRIVNFASSYQEATTELAWLYGSVAFKITLNDK